MEEGVLSISDALNLLTDEEIEKLLKEVGEKISQWA